MRGCGVERMSLEEKRKSKEVEGNLVDKEEGY